MDLRRKKKLRMITAMTNDDFSLEADWNRLAEFWQARFAKTLSLQAALWLISLQEFPLLHAHNLSSDPVTKEDLLHIAVCFLLEKQGFCKLESVDFAGWPIYSSIAEFEKLSTGEQENILARAVIDYFADSIT